MADDFDIKDGLGADLTIAAKNVAGVLVPRHILVDETNTAITLPTAAGQATNHTDLAAILAKIIAAPATDATLSAVGTVLTAFESANHTDLAAIKALLPAALGQGTMAQSSRSVIASDQTTLPVGGVYNSTAPTLTTGQRGDLQLDAHGAVFFTPRAAGLTATPSFLAASSDGLTASSQAGFAGINFGYLFNGTSWDRQDKPNLTSRIASAAASVNATSAKGSAGNVFRVIGNNTKAAVVYLKIYNKASAPTVGTDTPVLVIPLAASSRFNETISDAVGFYLGTGVAYGFTTDAADNGTTPLAAGDILDFQLTYA